MNKKPLLFHIPHSSVIIPGEYKNDFITDISDDLRHMTDWYTDELFDMDGKKVVFPISRLICDPERFRDDKMEEMFKRGMGTCYTHGYKGNLIRSLSDERKKEILNRWYDPHHDLLKTETCEMLKKFGICFIIDCHSFPASPLPYETNKALNRPDFCIGIDNFHTPKFITESLANSFFRKGYSVDINAPFSGTIVPFLYYHKNASVCSVMIEINRSLYLDDFFQKTPGFNTLKRDIAEAIAGLMKQVGY